jgi:C1A family cysteine protease
MSLTRETPNGKGFGYIPDLPDIRDHTFSITKPELIGQPLPTAVDLRKEQAMQFPILDQGQLGSCTANAIAAAMAYATSKQGKTNISHIIPGADPYFLASRLFIYYNEREMENTINTDAGAMIRDGIKSVNQLGACREGLWPYNIQQFTQKPVPLAYDEAQKYQALQYRRLNNQEITQLKGCIAQGFPFVFGFAVYQSFYKISPTNAVMPMPPRSDKLLGGHAVLAVGYDDHKQLFTIRNSWGDKWGDKGYFYMPYKYITNHNLCDDFWTITLMEQEQELLK